MAPNIADLNVEPVKGRYTRISAFTRKDKGSIFQPPPWPH